MKAMPKSVVSELCMNFSIRIVKFYKYLTDEKKVFVLSKQLLRSGTSIGANVFEAEFAQSKPDFVNKMSIALKEANETQYWLELLYKSEIIDEKAYISLDNDAKQITGTLVKIINSSKKQMTF